MLSGQFRSSTTPYPKSGDGVIVVIGLNIENRRAVVGIQCFDGQNILVAFQQLDDGQSDRIGSFRAAGAEHTHFRQIGAMPCIDPSKTR
jgi:hypothetical protein